MKALMKLSKEPGAMEIVDTPIPAIQDDEVLIRVKAVGVCGTDLKIFDNTYPYNPPVIVGHEFAGVVEVAGEKAGGYAPGCRVVCEQHFNACGKCCFCLTGRRHLCLEKKSPGYLSDGAYAEYIAVNHTLLHAIPEELSYNQACLLEPMAIAAQALFDRPLIRPEDTVAVLGCGPISLMAVQMLKAQGAGKIVVTGLDSDVAVRFTIAESFGARTINAQKQDPVQAVLDETDGAGVDVVIDLSGAEQAIQQGFRMLHRQGRFCAVGIPDRDVAVPWKELVMKAVDIRFSFSSSYTAWERCLSMLRRGAVSLEHFTKSTYPLEDWRTAFDDARTGNVLKAIILP